MKKKIIILLTSLPFLAIGQSGFTTEKTSDKTQISAASNNAERQIETTLINDATPYKSLLNLDLDKNYDLSLTLKNDKIFNFLDDHKLDGTLLELTPLKNSKWQFRKPIETYYPKN